MAEKKYIIDNPTLMSEWNWGKNDELKITPQTLTLGSNKKVWWECDKCGYMWETSPNKGIRQRNLGNDCFSFIDIPVFNEDLQKQLECLIKKHIQLQEESKKIYLEAERELENCIGIMQETQTKQSTVKSFKDSFEKTGRFDSEYYHPQYEIIENQIKGENKKIFS